MKSCLFILFFPVIVLVTSASSTLAEIDLNSTDTYMVVVPARSTVLVEDDISYADSRKRIAERSRDEAKALLEWTKSRIDVRKREAKSFDDGIKTAKKEKQSAQLLSMTTQKKAVERVVSLLNSQRELRDAEVDLSNAELDEIEKMREAFLLELELSKKRIERDTLSARGGDALTLSTLHTVVFELEGKLLDAQQKLASSRQTMSSREKSMVDRRRILFESQNKLRGLRK